MKITKGDTFEIKTKTKTALIQFIEKDVHGELTKVFIISNDKLDNIEILKNKEDMFLYFMLSLSNKHNLVKYIGNYEVSKYSKPQFMRTIHRIRGEFLGWHIVNLDSLKRELHLTLNDEQLNFSPYGVANPNLLIEWIENDYNLKIWGNVKK